MNALKPRPPVRPHQVNFRVTNELKTWLETYATNVGTSQADLVFQLINNIKEQQEMPK